jgi:hypothetical protein
VIERGVVEDAMAQQRPVLHQTEHEVPPNTWLWPQPAANRYGPRQVKFPNQSYPDAQRKRKRLAQSGHGPVRLNKGASPVKVQA